MDNREFTVEMITEFINNVIELTQHDKIKWDITRPQYDGTKLSQQSLCIRLTAEFCNKQLILISQNNIFNFEVIFKDISDIAEELPLITDDKVQRCLEELYALITKRYKIYSNFKELFFKANLEVSFLAKN